MMTMTRWWWDDNNEITTMRCQRWQWWDIDDKMTKTMMRWQWWDEDDDDMTRRRYNNYQSILNLKIIFSEHFHFYVQYMILDYDDNEEMKMTKFGVKHDEEAQVNGHTCIIVLCIFALYCQCFSYRFFCNFDFRFFDFFVNRQGWSFGLSSVQNPNFDFSILWFFWISPGVPEKLLKYFLADEAHPCSQQNTNSKCKKWPVFLVISPSLWQQIQNQNTCCILFSPSLSCK